MTRRDFLGNGAVVMTAAGALGAMQGSGPATQPSTSTAPAGSQPTPKRPCVIASANGMVAVSKAFELIVAGLDPLDAVIAGVNIVEDDPKDTSVGYGGLPNEEGVVELDASVMHGPSHKAGAVASLRNIRYPSRVARLVMKRTDHVLLVGEGALRFARHHGFKEEDLLTAESREAWLRWRDNLSTRDNWLPPASAPAERVGARANIDEDIRHYGTINCLALTEAGDLAGCTSTSGLAFKLPGRVGDSPIIGAGLYVDNAVGAAGSTGRGEANLQNLSSFAIVELMRTGMTAEEAVMAALKRVADHTEPRLRNKAGRPSFDLKFYALSRDGRHAGGSIYGGTATSRPKYAVNDGGPSRTVECAFLYEGRAED